MGIIGLIVTFLVVVFIAGILGMALYPVFDEVNQEVQGSEMSAESKTMLQGQYDNYGGMNDNITISLVIFLWIGMLIGAYFFTEHPIILVFMVVILIALTFVAAILSNTYEDFISEPDYLAYQASLPITAFVMSYYPFIILGIVFSSFLTVVMRRT
jgi:hypothetical protein